MGDLVVQPEGGRDLGNCPALSPWSIPQEEGWPTQGRLVSEVSDWLVVWASHCAFQGLFSWHFRRASLALEGKGFPQEHS